MMKPARWIDFGGGSGSIGVVAFGKLAGTMGTTCKCFAKRWDCSRQQSGPD
jgi:hypothetical protein